MRWHRIEVLVTYDFLLFFRVKWKLAEFVYFPITTVIIWGLFIVTIRDQALEAGLVVLAVNIFWNFAYLAQSMVNMQMMEDTWSGSLKQILLTGITGTEYLLARMISTSVLSLGTYGLMWGLSLWLFDLPATFYAWIPNAVLCIQTLLASLGIAALVAGVVLLLGREYGFLGWTVLQFFILFSAPFYPIEAFPPWIRWLVYLMPYTDVFQNTRVWADEGTLSTYWTVRGAVMTGLYFFGAWPFYVFAFRRARRTGMLVQLE